LAELHQRELMVTWREAQDHLPLHIQEQQYAAFAGGDRPAHAPPAQ
jgi:hypothetical protein